MRTRGSVKKIIKETERNIVMFFCVVIAGFALLTGIMFWPKLSPGVSSVMYEQIPAVRVPDELASLVGFHFVKPYNIGTKPVDDTTVMYTATFKTKHLEENYKIFKTSMVKDRGFKLVKDSRNGGSFSLNFVKNTDKLQISSETSDGANGGAITLQLYKKADQ